MGVIPVSRNVNPRKHTSFQGSPYFSRNSFANARDLSGRSASVEEQNQQGAAVWGDPLRIHDQAGEITAIPNPTPDTGLRPTHERGGGYPFVSTPGPTFTRIHLGSLTEHISMGSIQPTLLPPSGITITVPAAPRTTTSITSMSTTSTANSITIEPLPTSDPSSLNSSGTTRPILPLAAIILVVIGGLCLLVVVFIILRWFKPPRRRHLPKPSLPKFEIACADEEKNAPTQESPLFGPNERFSQRSGANTTWSWVTYPQVKAVKHEPSNIKREDAPRPESIGSPQLPGRAAEHPHRSSSIYPPSSYYHTPSAPLPLSAGQPSMQQVEAAASRATNRMSTLSLSQKGPCLTPREAGTTYTADGHDVMKRRSKSLRKSRSHSIYEDRGRDSRASVGLAYDGAEVASPMEFAALESPGLHDGNKVASRSRIQSSYYLTASYPRISSAIPTTYGVATRVKVGDVASIRGPTTPKMKSELQKAEEARALTRALGLCSPTVDNLASSPQPSLYPEDSLSFVESKRLLKQRSQKRRISTGLGDDSQWQSYQVSDERCHHLVATPMRSVVAVASGSLMSADDLKGLSTGAKQGTSLTGPTLTNSKSSGTKPTLAAPRSDVRRNDRPPRVPSPPQLPSLAQMALEHGNPDAYTSYRSPTYSIYNFYDDDRATIAAQG